VPKNEEQERAQAEARVLAATNRNTLSDAYYWITSKSTMSPSVDRHALLRDLVFLDPDEEDGKRAIVLLVRELLVSDLDTAAVILSPDRVRPAERFAAAFATLRAHCPYKTISAVNESAFLAAQQDDAFVIEALCAVASVSFGDLKDRVPGLPASPSASWSPSAAKKAFAAITDILNAASDPGTSTSRPVAPLDMIRAYSGIAGATGWAGVEERLARGVPYEVLLAQRVAGGTWLAHRQATANKISPLTADVVCVGLDEAGVSYLRSTIVDGDTSAKDIQALAKSDKQLGILVMSKDYKPVCGIVFQSAREGGTARKSGASLVRMKRDPNLPMALVLTGLGWAQRNETVTLARAFAGRVYSERGISALIADIKTMVASRDAAQ
jgi:hypothetical protein